MTLYFRFTQQNMQPPITPDAFKELIKTLRYQYISLPEQMVYNSFASIINDLRRAFPIYVNFPKTGTLYSVYSYFL